MELHVFSRCISLDRDFFARLYAYKAVLRAIDCTAFHDDRQTHCDGGNTVDSTQFHRLVRHGERKSFVFDLCPAGIQQIIVFCVHRNIQAIAVRIDDCSKAALFELPAYELGKACVAVVTGHGNGCTLQCIHRLTGGIVRLGSTVAHLDSSLVDSGQLDGCIRHGEAQRADLQLLFGLADIAARYLPVVKLVILGAACGHGNGCARAGKICIAVTVHFGSTAGHLKLVAVVCGQFYIACRHDERKFLLRQFFGRDRKACGSIYYFPAVKFSVVSFLNLRNHGHFLALEAVQFSAGCIACCGGSIVHLEVSILLFFNTEIAVACIRLNGGNTGINGSLFPVFAGKVDVVCTIRAVVGKVTSICEYTAAIFLTVNRHRAVASDVSLAIAAQDPRTARCIDFHFVSSVDDQRTICIARIAYSIGAFRCIDSHFSGAGDHCPAADSGVVVAGNCHVVGSIDGQVVDCNVFLAIQHHVNIIRHLNGNSINRLSSIGRCQYLLHRVIVEGIVAWGDDNVLIIRRVDHIIIDFDLLCDVFRIQHTDRTVAADVQLHQCISALSQSWG